MTPCSRNASNNANPCCTSPPNACSRSLPVPCSTSNRYAIGANMMGKREDKNLEQQTTMALIRELKLGASKGTKVILVGKDGERHMLKDDDTGEAIDPQVILKAVDELPASEKAVAAPEPVAAAPQAKDKDSKPAKPAKPAAPPKPLED